MIGIKGPAIGIKGSNAALKNPFQQFDRITTGFAGLTGGIRRNPQATGDEVGPQRRSAGESIRRNGGR